MTLTSFLIVSFQKPGCDEVNSFGHVGFHGGFGKLPVGVVVSEVVMKGKSNVCLFVNDIGPKFLSIITMMLVLLHR